MPYVRPLAMALCLVPALATAAQPRERWSFAWDAHPQATQVSYFVLQIDVQSQRWLYRIPSGTATTVRDIAIDPAIVGDGSAVLRACTAADVCSADSNRLVIDRTPPQPVSSIGFTNQR